MIHHEYIIVAGPTASGKSALALDLAHRLNGEVINADSLQVYSHLKILTARPDNQEEGIPHHLYGFLSDDEKCTAALWVQKAVDCILEIKNKGKLPILTGGTGLYLWALTRGIAPIPEVSEATQKMVDAALEKYGRSFYDYVVSQDPHIAQHFHANDYQRLGRALGVFLETNKSIAHWQQETKPLLDLQHLWCVLEPDRPQLYERINQRFNKMIKAGAIDEVKHLQSLHLSPDHTIYKAIGVQELEKYLQGTCSLENAVEEAQQATRQYAKRQMTWFRNQVKKKVVLSEPDSDTICEVLLADEDAKC